MTKWKWAAVCCLALYGVYGQQDSTRLQELEEVVVSDTRFPIPREQSGKTVIRLEQADRAAYRGQSVAEILNRQTGLEISGSRGRPGEVLGVFARGGRGRQVLVLIDGVRVTDPSSVSQEYDLRLLQAEEIASIEILKGASSSLYGTNAATAVIRISTKRAARKPLEIMVQQQAGTLGSSQDAFPNWGQFGTDLRLSGTSGEWSYKAGFGYRLQNGLSSLETETNEKDRYRNTVIGAGLTWKPTENWQLDLTANQTYMRSAYDDSGTRSDADFDFLTDQERFTLSAVYEKGRNRWEARAAYAAYDSENQSNFPGTQQGRNVFAEVVYKREWGDYLYSLAGITFLSDKAALEQDQRFTLTDPYLNLVWLGPGRFNLNTGIRYNFHSEYGGAGVYQINPSWSVPAGRGYLKFFGSWATSYITPSLLQLFGPFGANPELVPERNRTLETGLEWKASNAFRLNLLFFNRLEEAVVLFDNAAFRYFNAAEDLKARGVEAELQWDWSPAWSVRANYAFTEREGDAAIRIPRHKLNTRLGYAPDTRLNAWVSYRYTGSRTDTDFVLFEEVTLDAFSLWDARISYAWWDNRLRGFLGIDNIFNTEYTEIIGFQTPGRNIIIGWSLRL